jgi:cyclophilin family peptidyl-prolyl cis-trans isomerase
MNPRFSIVLAVLAMLALSAMSQLAHAAAPAAPSGCRAATFGRTATSASIDVSWNDNSTTESEWRIQVSVNGGAFAPLTTVSSTTTASIGGSVFFTWPAASLDTIYRFTVIAANVAEVSNPSNAATVGTFDLNGPINFSVTALDPFNVIMSWEESSTSEAGFSVEQQTSAGPWVILGTLAANTLSVVPLNLIEPLTTYSFRIRAYKGGAPTTPDSPTGATAVSAYSNVVQVNSGPYTLAATAVPGQPIINLSWPNILNEHGYQLLYLPPGGFQYKQLTLLAPNVTAYQVTGSFITAPGTYHFIVRPYINSQIIGESNEAVAIVDGITSKTGTSGTPASAFSHTFTQVSAAAVTLRTLTGIPDTLSFDSATGILSGTYPPLGNYTLNYTVNLANGAILTQAFSIRVRPPAGPPLVGIGIPAWTATVGTSRDTALAGTFTDPEAESAVRVSTTLGDMDFILFDSATPATVANFMSYVNAGKYTDVAFHRSIASFVIQGGGFKGTGSGSNFASVATAPPVVNEPGIANLRGTISMAKVGGNPNSATSQFFVSLGDNTSNLDYQNGGFTVFGRVAGNGMTVADAINGLPTGTYNLYIDGSPVATPFADFPMNNPVLPNPMDQAKLVKINSVTSIPTLAFSVTGNTRPDVTSASIVNGQLHLVGLAGGETTITVTATDLDGLTTSQTVPVTLSDTFTTWASRHSFPGGQNRADQNPDGDSLTNLQEYALFGDPGLASEVQVPLAGLTGAAPAPRFLTLAFPVRKFTTGLSYVVEANPQLAGPWTTVWSSENGFSHPQVVSAVDQVDRALVTIKDTAAITGQSRRFLRLKVIQD